MFNQMALINLLWPAPAPRLADGTVVPLPDTWIVTSGSNIITGQVILGLALLFNAALTLWTIRRVNGLEQAVLELKHRGRGL